MSNYISQKKYHPILRLFHWVIALMIFTLLAAGFYMTSLPNDAPGKYDIYGIHKSFGVLVFLFVIIRLFIRTLTIIPKMENGFSKYIVFASQFGHFALYFFMFLMPVSGFLMSQYGGYPVGFFGLQIPTLVEKDSQLGSLFHEIHEYAPWVLMAILALHIAATLKHRYIDKKDVLYKMT